jgi:predicted ABC-type exoprotein transport system permease subunit
MMSNISIWLFKRRIQSRWHVNRVLLSLFIDIWVAVYLIIPALILIVSTYRDWLQALPTWYLPAFQSLWIGLIILLVSLGKTRTYMTRADLVLVYPNRQEFKILLTLGQILSTLLHFIPLLVVMFFAYPFFYHVQGIKIASWLWTGVWILVLKTFFLNINWHLSQHMGRWGMRLIGAVMFVVLMLGWYLVIEPYMLGRWGLLPALFSVLLVIILVVLVGKRFRINNWDYLMAEEEFIDIDRMRLFLGNAAQVEQQGSSGQAHIVKGRMGIAFKRSRVFTYFFAKYFSRKKQLWKQFGQFYALAAVILLSRLPAWIIFVSIAAILVATGAILQLFWKEHSKDLFLCMLPLTWEEIQQGLTIVFYIIAAPFGLFVLIAALLGQLPWGFCLSALIGLTVLTVIMTSYLSLKAAVLFTNHEEFKQGEGSVA